MNTATAPAPTAARTEGGRVSYRRPSASLRAGADEYILELDLPGVTRDRLELHVENNELTVTAHAARANEDGTEVLYTEFVDGGFRRAFEIDPQIDTSKIDARLEHGVLTLRLPKSEAVKPRRIQVAG